MRGDRQTSAIARIQRLIVQCRDVGEAALCDHLALAFAREAGLRGLAAWYLAASAGELAANIVKHGGGGELELRRLDSPRRMIELTARDRGRGLTEVAAAIVGRAERRASGEEPSPRGLAAVRAYMNELTVESQPGRGTVVTARMWLDP